MRKISLLGLIGLSSLLLTSMASATTLISPSEANISGTVTVNNSGVFFSDLTVQSPNTGSFDGLSGVTLQPLTGSPQTGAVSIPKFATFTATGGNVYFDLQNIYAGIGTAGACGNNTVGNVCTVAGSPFTLIQAAPGQVDISLSLSGIAYTGSSADGSNSAPFSFTSQNVLMPGTITGIIDAAQSADGFTNSFSATISTNSPAETPEPASCLLMGSGLAAAGLIARRRARS